MGHSSCPGRVSDERKWWYLPSLSDQVRPSEQVDPTVLSPSVSCTQYRTSKMTIWWTIYLVYSRHISSKQEKKDYDKSKAKQKEKNNNRKMIGRVEVGGGGGGWGGGGLGGGRGSSVVWSVRQIGALRIFAQNSFFFCFNDLIWSHIIGNSWGSDFPNPEDHTGGSIP